jgi:hypothetical protein
MPLPGAANWRYAASGLAGSGMRQIADELWFSCSNRVSTPQYERSREKLVDPAPFA